MSKNDTVAGLIEKASESVVMLEADDRVALTELKQILLSISGLLQGPDNEICKEASTLAAALVGRLSEGKESNPAASLDVVARTVNALQMLLRDGRSLEEAPFPQELLAQAAAPGSATPRSPACPTSS